MSTRVARVIALGAGASLAAASLVTLGVSIRDAELLSSWRLPGLAALLAIASNVGFLTADRAAVDRGAGRRR